MCMGTSPGHLVCVFWVEWSENLHFQPWPQVILGLLVPRLHLEEGSVRTVCILELPGKLFKHLNAWVPPRRFWLNWFGVNLAFGIFIKLAGDSTTQPGLKVSTLGLDTVLSALLPVFFLTLLLKTESNSQWIDVSCIHHLHCLQINLSKPVADRLLSRKNFQWLPPALHESKIPCVYLSFRAVLGIAPIFFSPHVSLLTEPYILISLNTQSVFLFLWFCFG